MSIARRLAALIGTADPDVQLWRLAVMANGGWVSPAVVAALSTFVAAEKASGTWALTDDYFGLWAENSAQALTSLKQRRLATAINSPVFTPSRGYSFDGSTSYIDTGYIPSTHAVAATTDNIRLDVYERTNVSSTGYTAGTTSATGSRSIRLSPRAGGGVVSGAANTNQAGSTFDLPLVDSRGLTAVSRNAASAAAVLGYKNGVLMNRSVDATGFGTTLPSHSLYLGAVNQIGAVSGLRASSLGFASIGASLSGGQELARYNAVQALATAMGANV